MKTQEKSTRESKLSDYGYDMVVAVTQGSINATLRNYLDHLKKESQTVCWKTVIKDDSVVFEEANYEEIKQRLGKDLFNIPRDPAKRTEEDNKILRKAYDEEMFAFAFKYQFGYLPQYEGKIIELADETGAYDKQQIFYNLHFKEFQIIHLDESHRKLFFQNITQESDTPFIFKSKVNLSMEKVSESDLPKDIKDKIYNMGGDMFSIQQLFLDVNTARLQSTPCVEGLAPEAMKKLVDQFYYKCWLEMSKSGKIIFHYAAKGKKQNNISDLIPTQYDFCINPFSERKDTQLYTLNYLVMTNNRTMPAIREVNWNWIEKEEYSHAHGAIAIREDIILQPVLKLFRNQIERLLLQPVVNVTSYVNKFRFNKLQLKPSGFPDVQYERNKNSWSICFEREAVHCGHVGANATENHNLSGSVCEWKVSEAHLKYTMKSEFIIDGNKITHKLFLVAYLEAWQKWWAKDRVGAGNIFLHESTTDFYLAVGSDGEILVDEKIVSQKNENNNFKGDKEFDIIVRNIDTLTNNLHDIVSGYQQTFLSALNSALKNFGSVWILPGHDTFMFKNVLFSEGLDLTAHLTYKNNF